MTKQIMEVFWNAACSCGWRTDAPNDADTVANKVKTHLQQEHRLSKADISITSFVELRPIGTLPLSTTSIRTGQIGAQKVVAPPADAVAVSEPE